MALIFLLPKQIYIDNIKSAFIIIGEIQIVLLNNTMSIFGAFFALTTPLIMKNGIVK